MILSGELANEKEIGRAEIDGLHEQCEKLLRQNSSLLKSMATMEQNLEKGKTFQFFLPDNILFFLLFHSVSVLLFYSSTVTFFLPMFFFVSLTTLSMHVPNC